MKHFAPLNTRLRIVLGAVLAILIVTGAALLWPRPGDAPISDAPRLEAVPDGPGEAPPAHPPEPGATPNVQEVVQTLFAQTAIAAATVEVNVGVQVNVEVNLPTGVPTRTPTIPMFPEAARQAISTRLREGEYFGTFTVISAEPAVRPGLLVRFLDPLPDEAWCVRTTPVNVRATWGSSRTPEMNNGVAHFTVIRTGLLWVAYEWGGSLAARGTDSRWLQAGCGNW